MAVGNLISVGLVCGLDLGDMKSRLCLCTAQGEVLEQGQVPTTAPGLGACAVETVWLS